MKHSSDRQVESAVRCACYFRNRARRAASPEARIYYLHWMRVHAREAAQRIQILRLIAAARAG